MSHSGVNKQFQCVSTWQFYGMDNCQGPAQLSWLSTGERTVQSPHQTTSGTEQHPPMLFFEKNISEDLLFGENNAAC